MSLESDESEESNARPSKQQRRQNPKRAASAQTADKATSSGRLQVHLAHNALDYTEIRVRGATSKPQVTLASADKDGKELPTLFGEVCQLEVTQSRALAGSWRFVLTKLSPGVTYSATVSCHALWETLCFRTLDAKGLGRRRMRLGVLSDAHVNLSGYHNGQRLYAAANNLLEKYAVKLVEEHVVDRLVLPGDVCDTGAEAELGAAAALLRPLRAKVPVHVVIGNHEHDPARFSALLVPESPRTGYYSVDDHKAGVHLVLLATNRQESLDKGSAQLKWLQQDLAAASRKFDIILVFLHYSLVLHPLHNGSRWDDGRQVLHNARGVLALLRAHPQVRAVICGHKNVPSALVDSHGLLHTLSPQLIQVPCGYDIFDVYDGGLVRAVYEIEEMELQEVSRRGAGEQEASQRWGEGRYRSFRHDWAQSSDASKTIKGCSNGATPGDRLTV